MRDVFIYGLYDPRVAPIHWRYVGKSVDTEYRLSRHCCLSSLRSKSHRSMWVQSLLEAGVRPALRVLEIVPEGHNWQLVECKWIMIFHNMGYRLTNGTDGGDDCYSVPAVVRSNRRRKGEKRPPVSDEWREKQRVAHLGRKQSPEWITKKSASLKGHVVSVETRKKVSDALKGRPKSEAAKRSMSECRRGVPHPKKRITLSEEHKKHISEGVSRATRGKSKPGLKRYWARKRAERSMSHARS